MRLIDADALKRGLCVECTLYPNKCLGDDCDWDSIYHIEHAPTIDAIPVDYIQHLIEICDLVPVPICAGALRLLLESYKELTEETT